MNNRHLGALAVTVALGWFLYAGLIPDDGVLFDLVWLALSASVTILVMSVEAATRPARPQAPRRKTRMAHR